MSSDIAIHARDVKKCYELYAKPPDRLKQALWRGHRKFYREFWALKGVSFDVRCGETVGIMGRNGAGKSTLLQIICGTLTATGGEVAINGRVAALLELSSGFNPEFTGRENVYMKASIMGLKRREIEARYKSIAAFADIGDFIERPVKTYSSGMQVRLAFAVAISSDPDILVVDEALAVGDAAFQRKCYARIQEIQSKGGTILVVSHGAQAVIELCDRAMLLDHGEMLLMGSPRHVLTQYHRMIFAPEDKVEQVRKEILRANAAAGEKTSQPVTAGAGASNPPSAPDRDDDESYDPGMKPKSSTSFISRGAIIKNPRITSTAGKPANILVRGKPYLFCYAVEFTEAAHQVRFSMSIKTMRGTRLGGGASHVRGDAVEYVERGTVMEVRFRFRCALQRKFYFVDAAVQGVVDGSRGFLHRLTDATMFRVARERGVAGTGMVDFAVEAELIECSPAGSGKKQIA